MLDILPAAQHVAAFRYEGELTGADYDRSIDTLESKLREHPRIGVYLDLSAMHGVTGNAWVKDLRYAVTRRKDLHKFGRVAVVSDRPWLRWIAQASSRTLPGVCLHTFTSREASRALEWSGQRPLSPEAGRRPGLRLIPTNRRDTYAFAWNGRVTLQDVEDVARALNDAIASQHAVRFFARIERLGTIELAALLRPSLWRLKLLGAQKVERYAVVGGPALLERYTHWVRSTFSVDMRYFESAREHEAWAWLEAQPVSNDARASTEERSLQPRRGPKPVAPPPSRT
jgi:hypothetical protein